MNILGICYEYPPIGGGGGIGLSQYAEAWVRKGHRVTVLTGWARGLAWRERVNGVDVVRVWTGFRRRRATCSLLSMLCFNVTAVLYALLHRSELRRVDVVSTHFVLPTGPAAAFLARWTGRPNVLTIIGGDIYDPSKRSSPHRSGISRSVNRWLIGAAERVVAISSDTRDRARRYYGVERDIQVINYGFSPAAPQTSDAIALEPGRFHLIGVGRMIPRKGFDLLIRAMTRLPDDAVLLLVGDGPLETGLGALARELGVADRVRLLGFRSRAEIAGLLRRADCFVLSSLHEGLGIVVQEAMDAGLPVVATDTGGQVDLIREPRNGLLVPVGDPLALEAAIRRLYDDRELAAWMGKNNRTDIQSLHIDENCERYLDVFRELTP